MGAGGCGFCESRSSLRPMGQEGDEAGEQAVQWIVASASSESEVHSAVDVLGSDLDKPWLTQRPTDDAWLVLARPPTVFSCVKIVNAGSALVEIHGLREEVGGDADGDYELLLSAQQVIMSFTAGNCLWV